MQDSTLVAAIAGIVLLLVTIAVDSIITHVNVFAYERNQAAPQTSECGNDFVHTNIGCQNTDSQIQGDGNAIVLAAQQTFPEVIQEEPIIPPPEEICGDSIDNDGDGAADENCPPDDCDNDGIDTVIATIPVGVDPQGIAVDTSNNMVYVVNFGSNSVSVIDGSTHAISKTLSRQ